MAQLLACLPALICHNAEWGKGRFSLQHCRYGAMGRTEKSCRRELHNTHPSLPPYPSPSPSPSPIPTPPSSPPSLPPSPLSTRLESGEVRRITAAVIAAGTRTVRLDAHSASGSASPPTCAHNAGAQEWACWGKHGKLPQTQQRCSYRRLTGGGPRRLVRDFFSPPSPSLPHLHPAATGVEQKQQSIHMDNNSARDCYHISPK